MMCISSVYDMGTGGKQFSVVQRGDFLLAWLGSATSEIGWTYLFCLHWIFFLFFFYAYFIAESGVK